MAIGLPDQEAEIEPVPGGGGGHKPEAEMDRLSKILKSFNDLCGNFAFSEADRVRITQIVTQELTGDVLADTAYQNAKQHSDKQNARIEHDKAVERAAIGRMKTDTAFFKAFMDNDSFRRLVMDTIFQLTYGGTAAS